MWQLLIMSTLVDMIIASLSRFLKSTSGLGAALLLGPVAALYLFFDSMCGNELLSEHYSPAKEFKAVVFRHDCGATTAFSTQVSVFHWWSWLGNSSGNTFVIDQDPKHSLSDPDNNREVKLHCRSPDTLVISHHSRVRVFRSEPQVGSVKVEYEKFPTQIMANPQVHTDSVPAALSR